MQLPMARQLLEVGKSEVAPFHLEIEALLGEGVVNCQ